MGMGKLNALQVKTLTEPGRYSDGEGLVLKIGPTGGKSWILRVQVNGCRRDIGLGDAKVVSLRDARESSGEMRKLARSGIDPLAAKKRQEVVIPTFREAFRLVHRPSEALVLKLAFGALVAVIITPLGLRAALKPA